MQTLESGEDFGPNQRLQPSRKVPCTSLWINQARDEKNRVLFDAEIVAVPIGQRFGADIAHSGEVGTLPQPVAQRVDCSFLAAGQYFDPPVGQIADIPRDAQIQSLFGGGVAKTDTLDTATDITTQAKGLH